MERTVVLPHLSQNQEVKIDKFFFKGFSEASNLYH